MSVRQDSAEETMPGDPKECRQHARRCAELAAVATTPEAREQFLSLQLSWIRLAADLDNAQTLIAALDEMDSGPPIKAAE
ncbi:MAG: hypothetical protein WBQ20_08720 [Methyloceanibacter sp.]